MDSPIVSPPQPTAAPSPATPSGTSRAVWVALVLIVAVMVGTAAGLLAYAGGQKVPMSILTGGGSFGGAVLLMLALIHFCWGKS
jgi:hypothetical protein